eukprot:Hpha_TRINITY_DN16107_c1_g16::TRINITY_DN16107_c1_g16_i1::g.4037::m.4037/K01279/TPP1, CLN2; tripeptidyl-peptidase I
MRAAGLLALGAVAACARAEHEVVVGLKLSNTQALEEAFWGVADPKSPEYLKHRSLADLSRLVGAPVEQQRAASEWLRSQGATSVRVSKLGDTVTGVFPDAPSVSLSVAAAPVPADFILHRGGSAAVVPREAARIESPELGGPSVKDTKAAYGIPNDLMASNPKTLQMVWGPGTFGYSPASLKMWKDYACPNYNVSKIHFDTANHGQSGGDNFMEGTLDVHMIGAFGLNVDTLVSNTNTSSSTEEGNGFGQALLDFLTELASRDTIPQVMSLSLGSLSAASCDLLCSEAVKKGHTMKECNSFLQQQRQVCMFLSQAQVARINQAFQVLGTRGMTIFGSSGDGGSHFSFDPFSGSSSIASTLNDISCEFQMPVFPTTSPYIVSVGGEQWKSSDPSKPQGWSRAGGGFSWEFGAPAHQTKAVNAYIAAQKAAGTLPPETSFNLTGRAYPDIVSISSQGTSQSSPMMAGIFSLLNDHRLNNGLPPLGPLGPRLWATMAQSPGVAFEDITEGDTDYKCSSGFAAAAGWDPASGWGRPKWSGMVKLFGADSHL